jgi:hypothetical protein
MLVGKRFSVAIALAILALAGGMGPAPGQTIPAEQLPPETVARLIAQLGASNFRSRQQATDRLEKLGAAALPALRKAAGADTGLEAQRRIELVVRRIEGALLRAEAKRWQDLGAPRRAVKDRILRILARTPALTDGQVVSAAYLLTAGRAPTNGELARAEKQLAGTTFRPASALRLARSLAQGNEFSVELAAANSRLLKAQADLATQADLGARLAGLNGVEFQKTTAAAGAALDRAVKGDEQLVHAASLLVLSRQPKANEARACVTHLRKARQRPTAAADVVWALMSTREFLAGR